MVESADPHVRFRTAHVQELQEPGAEVATDFDITVICEKGALHGTDVGKNSIGLQVSQDAFSTAQEMGLVNKSNGVEYLLSDRYGQPGIATGVGIELYVPDAGTKRWFIGRPGRVGIGHPREDGTGWYTMLRGRRGESVELPGGGQRIPLRLTARLKRIPGREVTPGRVHATATVLVKVQ